MPADAPSRPCCPRCERPLRDCLCRWITPVANEVAVLILQHPLEVHQAKGSARLLHLSLAHSRLVTGEAFEPAVLAEPDAQPRTPVLLYPPAPPGSAVPLHAPAPWPQALAPHELLLVVLDATWRKSRKLLFTHPWLQRLPRLSLQAPPPSRYGIRQAESAAQRSTLEATCLALQTLERASELYTPLLQGFDGFVAQQAAWRGQGRS